MLAGRLRDSPLPEQGRADREPVQVWLRRGVQGDGYWPVRLEAASRFGTVTGRLLFLYVLLPLLASLLTLVAAYPLAYWLALRCPRRWRLFLLVLVILPFWTSFLIRVYAWIGILRPEGLLDMALAALGLSDQPLRLLNTETAVLIGMVYSYLPFMVLPLYAALEKMDFTLLEAAADLGCRPTKAFWRITFPLSLPGVVAGSMLCFIPAVGEFVIPELLGGPQTLMIGRVMWDEFFSNNDWPMASTVAVVMVLLIIVPLAIFNKYQAEAQEARK